MLNTREAVSDVEVAPACPCHTQRPAPVSQSTVTRASTHLPYFLLALFLVPSLVEEYPKEGDSEPYGVPNFITN